MPCRKRQPADRAFVRRASRPNVCLTLAYQVSSSAAFHSTHCSSVIEARQARNGSASGPTG